MQEYGLYWGVSCFILAVYVLAKGIVAANRQKRENEAETLVPAYVFGIVASVLLTFGLGFLRVKLPWWGFRIVFPGTTLLFPAIIYVIGRRAPSNRVHQAQEAGNSSSMPGGSSPSDSL